MKYNDKLTSRLIDICEDAGANNNWFWLVNAWGTEESGKFNIIESGNAFNEVEYNKSNFEEKALEFAKMIPETY